MFNVASQLADRLVTTRVRGLAFDVTGRVARQLLDLCNEPIMTHPDGMQIKIFPPRNLPSRRLLKEMVGEF